MRLFIDMDDVVADFTGYANWVTNNNFEANGGRFPQDIWRKIIENQHVYIDLKVKRNAQDLVTWCTRMSERLGFDIYFLTALPRENDVKFAVEDKRKWAEHYFPGIPVLFGPRSQDKWQHCEEGDILIDDRESNCKEWEAAGGRAFMYRSNWPDCCKWLSTELQL